MNTQIHFTYKDVPYTLEYNREAIRAMENEGFVVSDFVKSPAMSLDIAFKGAFLKNHRKINLKLIEEIYEHMKNKEELAQTLIEMIAACYDTLLDDSKGNIEWSTAEIQ